MPSAQHILANTPAWVFLVLAYLVWQGVESLRPRTLPLWRVLIVPALFIASGVSRIVGGQGSGVAALAPWAAGAIAVMPFAFVTGPRLLAVNKGRGEVTRPGSPVPLVRNVAVFVLQYAVAVMTRSGAQGAYEAGLAAHVISGATAGYFVGWVIVALRHYAAAPSSPDVSRPEAAPARAVARQSAARPARRKHF